MIRQVARQSGFTIVELVVTMVVLAIIAAFAFPSYRGLSDDSAIRSSTMNLIATLNEARATSLSQRVDVTVTGTSAGWQMSYVLGGNTVKRSWSLANQKDTLEVKDSGGTDVASIVFQSNGFINAANTPVTFTLCDDRTSEKGRKVTLEKNGKVQNETIVCN